MTIHLENVDEVMAAVRRLDEACREAGYEYHFDVDLQPAEPVAPFASALPMDVKDGRWAARITVKRPANMLRRHALKDGLEVIYETHVPPDGIVAKFDRMTVLVKRGFDLALVTW